MLQQPAVAQTQELSAKLTELRTKANELKLHASDLEVRKSQLGEQRRAMAADANPAAINKQLADVEHELTATRLQIESMGEQIGDLETERDMSRAFSLKGPAGIATTAPAPRAGTSEMDVARTGVIGGIVLTLPLVLALTRRIWRRSAPRIADFENSPRLQRIEQAVESIALEVERIGEAQRFTTKLLAERQSDLAQPGIARLHREPGTITPH